MECTEGGQLPTVLGGGGVQSAPALIAVLKRQPNNNKPYSQ